MTERNRWPDHVEHHRMDAIANFGNIEHLLYLIQEANVAGDRVTVAKLVVEADKQGRRGKWHLQEAKRETKERVQA